MTDVIDPNSVISHELQLGQQLNRAVSEQDRDSFRLLLSSLSSDVEDHSQFHLPEQDATQSEYTEEQRLRLKFQLGPSEQLHASEPLDQQSLDEARVLQADGLTQLKLFHSLRPRPVLGEVPQAIPSSIQSQLPVWKRRKLEQTTTTPGEAASKPEMLLAMMNQLSGDDIDLKVEYYKRNAA